MLDVSSPLAGRLIHFFGTKRQRSCVASLTCCGPVSRFKCASRSLFGLIRRAVACLDKQS